MNYKRLLNETEFKLNTNENDLSECDVNEEFYSTLFLDFISFFCKVKYNNRAVEGGVNF